MAVCSLPRCGQIAVLFNITLGHSGFFCGSLLMDIPQKLTILNIACDLMAIGSLPRKGEIYELDFFLLNSVLVGHLLGVCDFKALLHQTVGHVVYIIFKMQTALSQPLQTSRCWGLNMKWLMQSVTNWKLYRFFSCYFGPIYSVTHFEILFFTFLRSFWRMNRLTMQLSTKDGDISDLMVLPACFRKSPNYWWLSFSRMHTSCHSRGKTSLLKVTCCLFLVTRCLLGLEFLTESLIRRNPIFAEVSTPSPLPFMQLFRHRMISFSGASFFFALACIKAFRLLQVRVYVP